MTAKVTPLSPLKFRVCDEDRGRYGDGWQVYDETALTRLPVAQLVELERALKAGAGLNLPAALNTVRRGDVLGDLVAMFVARWVAGERGDFADFDPLVLLAEWEPVDDEAEAAEGDDAGPPDLSPSTAPATQG